MRTLLFRSLKSSKISFHLFEDEFHNDFNFHKPTILDLKPLSLKCLSGSLIKHGIQTDSFLRDCGEESHGGEMGHGGRHAPGTQ